MFGLCFLTAGLLRKRLKKKPHIAVHILICTGAATAVLCAAGLIYLNIHYSAREDALTVFADSDSAVMTKTDCGYFIDGKGKDTALVFYPGAKVDSEAYLPLMKRLAEGGIDCFLLDMPMRMAIFDKYSADKVTNKYDYDTWLVSGHSMGGMIASGYAADHKIIDGAVLLAAYPTEKLPDSTALLSVYGTDDGVLDLNAYNSAKSNFPVNSKEIVIEGGNHAQFGDYGAQSGDGKAKISPEEQQKQTVRAILSFAEAVNKNKHQ